MKSNLLCIVFLSAVSLCQAQDQRFYCPASSAMGVTTKFDQWLTVKDSTVQFKTSYKQKLDSVSYQRVPANNPITVYFTDGVMMTTLSFAELPGSVKGIRYSHIVTMKPDARASNQVASLYCTLMPASK
jgi:hypothetical protein